MEMEGKENRKRTQFNMVDGNISKKYKSPDQGNAHVDQSISCAAIRKRPIHASPNQQGNGLLNSSQGTPIYSPILRRTSDEEMPNAELKNARVTPKEMSLVTVDGGKQQESNVSEFGQLSVEPGLKCDSNEIWAQQSSRNSFGSPFRPLTSQQNHVATSNLLDRLKMNFLRNHAAKPLSSSFNSQCMEIALCEAAFSKDVDSQFGGTFFGLPIIVKDLLAKYKGITELYDWQKECLKLNTIQKRRNLIYSLPTSGGKTLVAEILIWKEILQNEKDVIFVLPYVSIVQEKIRTMTDFALELNFAIEEYAGSKGQFPPKKHRKKHRVYIATIEKANTLINSLLELKRMTEIGLIVVDELHMLGEPGGRGALLESLLAKVRFCSSGTMIIGMSATLGNINDLKLFLDADLYSGNFRPVELREYIKVDNRIYSINPNALCDEDFVALSRTIDPVKDKNYTNEMIQLDPDFVAGLVMEVVPSNSCLVFCPTKKNCENVALLICNFSSQNLKLVKTEQKKELLTALAEGEGEICPILKKTIPYGVAYHHSGLMTNERCLLEEAYMAGTLCCLCCTSTLAAGVNLPAKRVILRSPYVGQQFISSSQMKQMMGRAGRAGIDTSGEGIVIAKYMDRKRVCDLFRVRVENCMSSMLNNGGKGLKLLLLSAIGLEIVKNSEDAKTLISKTLLKVQKGVTHDEQSQNSCISASLKYLKENGLICYKQQPLKDENQADLRPQGTCLEVTNLGRAAFKGSIDVSRVNQLYSDLKNGVKALILNTYLHVLYQITPYDVIESINPVPDIYGNMFMALSSEDLKAAKHIGITEAVIVRIMTGQKSKPAVGFTLRRFYVTLIIYSLWNQNSVWTVADKFQMGRGAVQTLLSNCTSFGISVLHFCQEIEELWAYQSLLVDIVKRLSYCVTMELLPLMELPSVKRARARLLYNAGFTDLNLIAQADPEALVKAVEHMPRKVAQEIVTAAKILLIKKAEELQEEVEDIASLIT